MRERNETSHEIVLGDGTRLRVRAIARDYVRATAARLPAGPWPAALRLATVDARSGARVVLDADAGVTVAHGVAAARAVPGVRPPVAVVGRALIDAALGTATNADLLCPDPKSLVIVTASPAQAEPGTLEGEFTAGLANERRALERAGVRVTVVHTTDAERAAMRDDLFSAPRAREAATAGRHPGPLAAGPSHVEIPDARSRSPVRMRSGVARSHELMASDLRSSTGRRPA